MCSHIITDIGGIFHNIKGCVNESSVIHCILVCGTYTFIFIFYKTTHSNVIAVVPGWYKLFYPLLG
jgi:hypothetical protein